MRTTGKTEAREESISLICPEFRGRQRCQQPKTGSIRGIRTIVGLANDHLKRKVVMSSRRGYFRALLAGTAAVDHLALPRRLTAADAPRDAAGGVDVMLARTSGKGVRNL